MKHFICWICVALQTAPSLAQAPARASDQQQVLALDDQERRAALRRDVKTLERLWSDEFFVNAPNNQVVVGKRAVLDIFVASGIIDFSVFERKIEHVRRDGSYFFVMGEETIRRRDQAAGTPSTRRRFTNIWKKERGAWRLFARHANRIAPR